MKTMECPDIYVQIPAYRDHELSSTLLELYGNAKNPSRLRTAVFWQRGKGERLSAAALALPNLELTTVPASQSLGCNWARQQLQWGWRGEPYTMLLDSHHKFMRGWDDMVLKMYHALQKSGVRKPLITAYLPRYRAEFDPEGRQNEPHALYPFRWENGILIRLISYPVPFWRELSQPQPSNFLSLHFVFAAGAFNTEVTFHPDIYFFGDEVLTGLRAHSWGYDMFHPHRVIGWHNYDRGLRRPHWDDHADWHLQNASSLSLLRSLYSSGENNGKWFGSERSIKSYETLIGVPLVK
jgi:Glycosyltransferase (GlcNAc)